MPHHRAVLPPHAGRQEGGFALLMAIFTLLLLAGMIVAGSDGGLSRHQAGRSPAANPVRAREIASAGLADALSWFRRQNQQPVTNFAPALDLAADPPINETSEPAIGLVREYEVAPGLWARYEVRLGVAAEPYTDEDYNGRYDDGEAFTDTNGSGKWNPASGTRDVSALRGEPVAGTVWLLESRGFIYERPRADLPLGEGVNTRLAIGTVGTEIRRMVIAPPAAAAICATNGSDVTIGSRARIRGGEGAGVAFSQSTGSPVLLAGSEVSGSPSVTAIPDYAGTLDTVFGLSLTQLKSMADLSTADADVIPGTLGEFTLTVIEDDIVFDAARPLRGTGIVVIQGNCSIVSGSNSFFNGLLWVSGDLEVRAPVYLRGICISNGLVDVRGTGGDYAELDYDDKIIDDLLVRMGRYRPSKAIYDLGRPEPVAAGVSP